MGEFCFFIIAKRIEEGKGHGYSRPKDAPRLIQVVQTRTQRSWPEEKVNRTLCCLKSILHTAEGGSALSIQPGQHDLGKFAYQPELPRGAGVSLNQPLPSLGSI